MDLNIRDTSSKENKHYNTPRTLKRSNIIWPTTYQHLTLVSYKYHASG